MASREINLILDKRKLSPQELKLRAQINRYMPVILIIYVILLVGVVGISLYVKSRISNLNKTIASEQEAIKLLSANESSYMLLKQKSAAIKNILNGRYPYMAVYAYFRNLETKGGEINSIQIKETGELNLNINLQGTVELDEYISSLLAEAQKHFRRIELGGISIQPSGNIVVSLLVDTLPNPSL